MIWWTKAQMGWGETNTTKIANPDGSAIEGFQIVFKNAESSGS